MDANHVYTWNWNPIACAHGAGSSCHFAGRTAMLVPRKEGRNHRGARVYTAEEPIVGYELLVDGVLQSFILVESLESARKAADSVIRARFRHDVTRALPPAPAKSSSPAGAG